MAISHMNKTPPAEFPAGGVVGYREKNLVVTYDNA
jgi:hypothetical protein